MATRILASWYKAGQDVDYPPVSLNSFGQEQTQVNIVSRQILIPHVKIGQCTK